MDDFLRMVINREAAARKSPNLENVLRPLMTAPGEPKASEPCASYNHHFYRKPASED